MKLTLFCRS